MSSHRFFITTIHLIKASISFRYYVPRKVLLICIFLFSKSHTKTMNIKCLKKLQCLVSLATAFDTLKLLSSEYLSTTVYLPLETHPQFFLPRPSTYLPCWRSGGREGSAHTRTATHPNTELGKVPGGDSRVDPAGKQEVETFFGRESSRWPIVGGKREKMGPGVVNRGPEWTDEVVGWFTGATIAGISFECKLDFIKETMLHQERRRAVLPGNWKWGWKGEIRESGKILPTPRKASKMS